MEGTGLLLLLVGPSGAGKNTLMNCVLDRLGDIAQMPTATTRPARPGEVDGQQRFFLSDERFQQLIDQGAFIEWQEVHGKRYGTLKSVVEEGIRSKKQYIADVEYIGAKILKQLYPANVVSIFIAAPSMEALEQRIRQRGAVSEEEVAIRLKRAQEELSYKSESDHVVINDDLATATEQLIDIILKERRRVHHEFNRHHRAASLEISPDRISS